MANQTLYAAQVLFGLPGVDAVEFSTNTLPHDFDKIRHELCVALSGAGLRIRGIDAKILLSGETSVFQGYIFGQRSTRPLGIVEITRRGK